MAPIPYPLINGFRFDWSTAEITVNGLLFNGIKSLSYKHELAPGELRGNHSMLIGRTRGKYSASGSIELYKLEYNDLIQSLGHGYLESSFTIVANYSTNGTDVITDTLIGCRLTSPESSPSEGEDPITVKSDLHIMYIIENGRFPLTDRVMLR